MSTTDQQVRSIRIAIKALYQERETRANPEILAEIDRDIVALTDAITALRNADTFRDALKGFLQ